MNRLILLCILQFAAVGLYAANKQPTIEKQPQWITVNKADYTATSLDAEAEAGYSDLSHEQQVSLEHKEVYYKIILHVLSEAGVQNQSQISIDFDPSYQKLAFHSIKIIRGNKTIDRLQLSKIKTIQQEKELNRFLYNGTLTAVLFLEDVRKDDIIEYSYTIRGFNPIFKNKYADNYLTQLSVPVYHLFYKLIVPKNRNVIIKNSLANIQPSIYKSQNSTSYEWTIKNSPALELEDDVPSWFDCFPAILISEFETWQEVADWALELFPFNKALSARLQKKVQEIKTKYLSVEDRVLAALRFVQDDVRYMGIEMGENSHKPHSPAQILDQRFGDCKDKAYLLCTLLKALEVEAYPVLNNTSYKKTIADWLPSPYSFDHTTVWAKVNNKTYWFDATISYQRGRLQDISYPDYKIGLIIKPRTVDLTTIPLQETGKVVSKETFYVKKLHGPVRLIVTTTSSGSFADNIRYSFKNNSIKTILKDYKELYIDYFKKIEADSLTYIDNEQTGFFTSKEYYTINDFWQEENGNIKVLIEPYFLNGIIKKPREEKRNMPFALTYPARYEEEIEIRLPEGWPAKQSNYKFNTSSFALNYEYSKPAEDIVLLQYKYENIADHIQPEQTINYLEEWNKAEKTIAFEISNEASMSSTISSSTPFNTSSGNGFSVAYTLLCILALVTYFYQKRRRI